MKFHIAGPASLKSDKSCYIVSGTFKSKNHSGLAKKLNAFNEKLSDQRLSPDDFFGVEIQSQTIKLIQEIRKFESIVGLPSGIEASANQVAPDSVIITAQNTGGNIFGSHSTAQALKVCEAIADLFSALGAEDINGTFVE